MHKLYVKAYQILLINNIQYSAADKQIQSNDKGYGHSFNARWIKIGRYDSF